jgi:hypothetical protein
MKAYIYDKTDKGRDEIATRKYHLAAKMRTLLVMIDGHRPLEALMKNFGSLGLTEDNVTELLAEGYIVLIDAGPEPEVEAPPVARVPAMSAKARMDARRAAATRAHDADGHEANPDPHELAAATLAAAESSAEQHMALAEFYTQTIKSTLGLRGMMLQLKVEKCGSIDDFRALREPYLEAVLKAKGREMALSLRGRLDRLLGLPATVEEHEQAQAPASILS